MYSMSQVTVNFNVNADAQGTVNVFSAPPTPTPPNVVLADATLPVSALYNAPGNGLLKFRGVNDTIETALETGFTTTLSDITGALQTIMNSSLNASGAHPFNLEKYATEAAYRNYPTFGHLALAAYTDFLFGHVAATAAIDNDTIFKNRMNGLGGADAQIASKLALDIKNLSAENCQSVVEQVLAQDISRATMADNDDESWQTLKFINGDNIYVSITLTQPTVTVLNAGTIGNLPAPSIYSPVTYHIKMTLAGGEEPPPPPADLSGIVSIVSVELGTGNINYDATETRTAYLRIKDYGVTTNYTNNTFSTTGGQLNYTTLLGIPLITHSAQSAITFMDAATNQPISNTLNLGNPATIGGLTITNINIETGAVSYSTTSNCIELVFVVTNNSGVDTFYDGIFNINGGTTGSIHFPSFTGGASLADFQGQTLSIAFRYNHYERASVNGVMIGSGAPAPAPAPAPSPAGEWLVAEGGSGTVSKTGIRTTFTSNNGYQTNFKTSAASTSGQIFTFTYTVVEVGQYVFALSKSDGTPAIIFVSQPNGTTVWFPHNPMGQSMPAGPGGTYAAGDVIGFTYNSSDGVRVLKNGAIDEGFNNIPVNAESYIYQLNIGSDENATTVAFDNITFTV